MSKKIILPKDSGVSIKELNKLSLTIKLTDIWFISMILITLSSFIYVILVRI